MSGHSNKPKIVDHLSAGLVTIEAETVGSKENGVAEAVFDFPEMEAGPALSGTRLEWKLNVTKLRRIWMNAIRLSLIVPGKKVS